MRIVPVSVERGRRKATTNALAGSGAPSHPGLGICGTRDASSGGANGSDGANSDALGDANTVQNCSVGHQIRYRREQSLIRLGYPLSRRFSQSHPRQVVRLLKV